MAFTLNRRGFLQFAAGGAAGLATAGVTLGGISQLNAAIESEQMTVPSGPESWAPSVCSQCPAGCGLSVRKIGKRAVKIQGNPLHPVNHGGLCPKGIAGLQALYHPDRLRAPLRNVGTREAPSWKELSWDEALGEVTARMAKIRQAGNARSVVLVDGHHRSLSGRLLRRFLTAYGSPNYLAVPSGLDALQAAVYLQQGVTRPVAFDLENARYVLSFGVNLLEGWGAPTNIMRSFGRWRASESGRRNKLVQVEPRFSVTAARADEWVAVRPGTEAALALGIAYVLITEGLYDQAFVAENTFGFQDWQDAAGRNHMGFRSLVIGEYRLNDVAGITGVPAETILRLGREFGQNRPALAIGDWQTSNLAGNPYAAMAVHSLNALMGSLDVPGGVLVQSPSPGEEEGDAGRLGAVVTESGQYCYPTQHLSRLPQAIVSQKPYPVGMLLINEANPVFSLPNGEAFRAACMQVPFIVSFASFLNDTAALSDLVLPACTDLERWHSETAPPTFAYALQSISPPAVDARHTSRECGDVVLALARALGGPVATALPYSGMEEYLKHEIAAISGVQSGSIFSSNLQASWDRLLERSGWWAPTYSNADELWSQMTEQGGWWQPTYYYGEMERLLSTKSEKFEFYSQTLAQWAAQRPEFAAASGFRAGDDRQFLPHQPTMREPDKEFPLLLMPFEVLPFVGGEGAHLPYLQQIAGVQLFEKWESWLEIHPEMARKLVIGDGDDVWIESRRGRTRVKARYFEGTSPEVVHLPLGYGHTAGPDWSCRGANPLGLLEERLDPVAGLPQVVGTAVKVYRA